MDALFALDKGGFRTAVNHIALYREPLTSPYQSITDAALASVGAKTGEFASWNVPDFSSLLGKSVAVDVHGSHIFLDENALESGGVKPSIVRYYVIAGLLRSRSGGRRWYDMKTMNSSIAVGVASGAGFLYMGQRRWRWMMTRPYMRVFASLAVCVGVTTLTRVTTRGMGLGTFAAQKNFNKAVDLVQCGSCLDEIRDFTDKQIEDIGKYAIPKMPTGEEVPEQVQEVIRRGNEAHTVMLGMNAHSMKLAAAKYKNTHCQWHAPVPPLAAAEGSK